MLGLSAEGSLVSDEQRRLREKTAAVNLQQQHLKDEEMRLNELRLQLEEDKLKVRAQLYSDFLSPFLFVQFRASQSLSGFFIMDWLRLGQARIHHVGGQIHYRLGLHCLCTLAIYIPSQQHIVVWNKTLESRGVHLPEISNYYKPVLKK